MRLTRHTVAADLRDVMSSGYSNLELEEVDSPLFERPGAPTEATRSP